MSLLVDAVHKDDRKHVVETFRAIQKDKQRQNAEFRIQTPSEKQKWIKLNAYVSEKGNDEIVVGIAIDITAERDYSDTLHKFNDKKNSILQILSHDLLGPLGNIQMSTFLLLEYSKLNEDDSVMELLDAQRSVTMIRDLINTEFLQTSESAFVKQRVDIVEILRWVLQNSTTKTF